MKKKKEEPKVATGITHYFTTIILHNVWMLQLAKNFNFLKQMIEVRKEAGSGAK
jgi:hypothetical protein